MEVSKKSSKKRNRDCSKYEQLTIAPIKWLPCNICNRRVYHYRECTSQYVYCSYDCFSILMLSMKNDYLHSKDTNNSCFNENPL